MTKLTKRMPVMGMALRAALAVAISAATVSGIAMAQAGTSLSFENPPRILVGLTRVASVTLSSASPIVLRGTTAPVSPLPPVTVPAGTEVTLSIAGSNVSWGFTPRGGATQVGQSSGPVLLGAPPEGPTPVINVSRAQGAAAGISGRSYRGCMVAIPSAGTILLANAVDIEDYVKSTVGAEIPDGWHLECQKAQAVAVRSYAAYKVGLTKGGTFDDWDSRYCSLTEADVRLWATDQVYRGVEEENPLSVEAATATRGVVLAYSSMPAATFYHSDAGGMTEEPPYVWAGGTASPYLRSVVEVPHESPYSSWTVLLTPSEVATGFKSLGIIPSSPPDIIAGRGPGVSGRWSGVSVETGSGPATVSATQFRAAFPQVRSMLFSSYSFGGGKETRALLSGGLTAYVQSDGQVAGVNLRDAAVIGGNGEMLRATGGVYATTGAVFDGPAAYALRGSGWGHGIGMSQYGAKAMAESGVLAPAILSHYYPETAWEQWWQ
ncbi:MAG: SpoIID/LytB domain-containing protein [Bacillota bacterium]